MGPDTVPTKKSAMARYDKVCRTLAQVTISCESEYGKTVFNECHSQFNDKDCEPRGPEHQGRRASICFIAHSRVSTPFPGALLMFPLVSPMSKKKKILKSLANSSS